MSMSSEHTHLAREFSDLYSKIGGSAYEEDLRKARSLAENEEPHDHWLMTNRLDFDSRLFLYMASAYAMRCMKHDPYKCAVFMRSASEALNKAQA